MISTHYAAALTMSDDVREWLEAHKATRNDHTWKSALAPGATVITLGTLGYDSGSEYAPTPYTTRWGIRSIKVGEIGRVVRPHDDERAWWLIEFGEDLRWWVYWDGDDSRIRPIGEPAINDPSMYDGTLL